MHPLDLATLAAFHKHHQHHPTNAGQVGWHHEAEQRLRFQVLSDIGPLLGHTVLDAGCGLGDFWAFLKTIGAPAHYTGFDCLPRFISQALVRWQEEPRVSLGVGDFLQADLPQADYVFASGSLNYPSQNPDHPHNAIRNLWNHARVGMAFNLLRQQPGRPTDYLRSYDPQAIMEYCQTLSPYVRLRTDYMPGDFTLYLYRNDPTS